MIGDGQATNDRPIQDIARDLARYVHTAYTRNGEPVDIVAHSMGGLVTRVALLGSAQGWEGFPPRLDVDNVVTLGTPHQDVAVPSAHPSPRPLLPGSCSRSMNAEPAVICCHCRSPCASGAGSSHERAARRRARPRLGRDRLGTDELGPRPRRRDSAAAAPANSPLRGPATCGEPADERRADRRRAEEDDRVERHHAPAQRRARRRAAATSSRPPRTSRSPRPSGPARAPAARATARPRRAARRLRTAPRLPTSSSGVTRPARARRERAQHRADAHRARSASRRSRRCRARSRWRAAAAAPGS